MSKDRFKDLCSYFVSDQLSEASFEDVKFVLESLGFTEERGRSSSSSICFINHTSGKMQIVPQLSEGRGENKKIKPVTSGIIHRMVMNLDLWNYVQ